MFQLRFKDIFQTLNGVGTASSYTLSQIVVTVLVTLFCAMIIYLIYKSTYAGVLFSKHMGTTMIIVSVITSLIVMAISGNLALSLGMVGALSIVRFRTPIKDPRDLAFLFWSVTNGIICGVGAYKMALVSVLAVSACLYFLSKRINWTSPYLLVLKMIDADEKSLRQILKDHCVKVKERSSTIGKKETEVVYEIRLKEVTSSHLLKKIKDIEGVEQAVMVSYEGELDESR